MDEKIAKFKRVDRRQRQHCLFLAVRAYRPRRHSDFRSVDGLYTTSSTSTPAETIPQPYVLLSETEEFYRFYRAKMLALDAKPNAAPTSSWPSGNARGKCRTVVTQNIDGLRKQKARLEGSELQGSVLRNYCMRYRKPVSGWRISPRAPAFRDAPAAALSSRMSCCTRRDSTAAINKGVDYISRLIF